MMMKDLELKGYLDQLPVQNQGGIRDTGPGIQGGRMVLLRKGLIRKENDQRVRCNASLKLKTRKDQHQR